MLKSVCGVRTKSAHYVQTRFAQRMRGKPPLLCKTIKQRLDELNYKDELYTTKIDIGFPIPKLPSEIRKSQLEHFKKVKSDKNFEKQARDGKIRVNLDEVRKEWLKTVGPAHLKKVAEHYGIFEHLYVEGYFMPLLNLEILYNISNDTYLPVYSGNVIKPAEAQQPPLVNFETDGNSLWTLVLTNLDGHLTENDKEYVHWLVANIPGNNIEKGDTIVEYLKPFPLKGTGYHRYVFVLYKQQGRVDYDITKVTSTALEQRTFVTKSWYQKYQDVITPTGLAFFQSDWDETVRDFFHKVLDTKEPVYEYDFPAPYIRPQEKHPRDKAFNIYMDRYRDPKQINKEYLIRKLKDEDPFKGPKPPLMYPNAHPLPHSMPSWLKLHETKIRMRWGRINEV